MNIGATRPAASSSGRGLSPTRTELLKASRALFVAHGYDQAPVRAICARAGVTVGAFYNCFATKRAALLEVVQQDVEAGVWDLKRPGRVSARRAREADALLLTVASICHVDAGARTVLAAALARNHMPPDPDHKGTAGRTAAWAAVLRAEQSM